MKKAGFHQDFLSAFSVRLLGNISKCPSAFSIFPRHRFLRESDAVGGTHSFFSDFCERYNGYDIL